MQKQYLVEYLKGGTPSLLTSVEELNVGDKVIAEIDDAMFFGLIVKVVSEKHANDELPLILRKANEDDVKKRESNLKKERDALAKAKVICEKHKLDIKLLTSDYAINNSKLVFTFSSEGKVDFRAFVKELASVFKTRIELKQIGVRDEAKIMGGYGPCGKEVCCKQFLNQLPPTSIKMAKNQGLSLNPAKISGLCGRIMCCMSYENGFYAGIMARMPKVNSNVVVNDRKGTVVYNDILREKVTVKFEDNNTNEIIEYNLDEIAPVEDK